MMEENKDMDAEQMYDAFVERAAVTGRFEIYSSLHKVICKHVEKLQCRMKTLIGMYSKDVTPSKYVHMLESRSMNDAQQDACFEILDILLSKINESAKEIEEWNKIHSESDDNQS